MSYLNEPDLGPITWVKTEIDHALARADDSLAQAVDAPDAAAKVQFAQTHLHQARGAFSIVGLDGLTQFAIELDQYLGMLARGECAIDGARLALARRALATAGNYLEELVHGTPDQPLRLFPLYAEILAARGAPPATPTELFFPDPSLRPPRRRGGPEVTDAEREQGLRLQRTVFERGLLVWLRDPKAGNGAQTMGEAIARIEALEKQPQAYALWFAAHALLDALASGDLHAFADIKRPITGLHALIRRLPESPASVPERLMREVLYWASQAPARTEHQQSVRKAWQLDALIPEPGAVVSDMPLTPLLRTLQASIEAVKLEWDDFCNGQAIALPRFEAQLAELSAQAGRLGRPALDRLLQGLTGFTQWLRKDPLKHNAVIAIEVAAALLLCEAALDRAVPDTAFTGQVADTQDRLDTLMRGGALPAAEGSLAVETARRAQEREAQSQLAREILSSLAQVEQTLDDFFRNHAKRAPLAALGTPLRQIEGALALLGETRALTLVHEAGETVARFAESEETPAHEEFEGLARKISALGFYVQALQHGGPADLDRFLDPRARAIALPEEELEEEPIEIAPPPVAAAAPVEPAASEARPPVPAASQPIEEPADEPATVASGAPEATPIPLEEERVGDIEPPAVEAGLPPSSPSERQEETSAAEMPLAADPVTVESDTVLQEATELAEFEALELDAEPALDEAPAAEPALAAPDIAFEAPPALEDRADVHAELHETVEALHEEHRFEAEPPPPARPVPAPAAETRKLVEASAEEIDAELLAIFIEEAHEVLATIGEQLELSRTEPDGGHLSAIRRAFHTLKGSGRMVGLRDLGEAAWGLEQTLNRWLQFDWQPTAALHHLIDAAHHEFSEWVAELEAGSTAAREVSALLAEAERLRSSDAPIETPALSAPFPAETVAPALPPEARHLTSLDGMDLDLDIDLDLDEADAPEREPAPAFSLDDALAQWNYEPEIDLEQESLDHAPQPATPAPADDGLLAEAALPDEISLDEALDALPLAGIDFGDLPGSELPVGIEALDAAAPATPGLDTPAARADQPLEALSDDDFLTAFDEPLERAPDEIAAAEEAGDQPAALPQVLSLDDAELFAPQQASPDEGAAAAEPLEDDLEALEIVALDIEPFAPAPATLLSDAPAAAPLGLEPDDIPAFAPPGIPAPDEQVIEALDDVPADEATAGQDALAAIPDEEVLEALDDAPADEATAGEDALTAVPGDFVRVGDIDVSRPLYDLYCGEARHHLALLHGETARMQANPTRVPPEAAVRAAHTLAGISGTARILSVHTLARALEHAIGRLSHSGQPPASAEADLLVAANTTLEAMLTDVENRRMPLAVPELEEQLDGIARDRRIEPLPSVAPEPALETAVVEEAAEQAPPVRDDIDDQLLPVFLEEGADLMSQLHAVLRNWRGNRRSEDLANATARLLHTLKGSARMAGAMTLGQHVHQLESRLETARKHGQDLEPVIEELVSGIDLAEQMMDVLAGAPAPLSDTAGVIEAADGEAESAQSGATLRVRAETVDRFVNAAGEIGIARTRIEGELRTLRRSLLDLTENVIRLRNQLREVEMQAEVQMQSRIAHADTRHAEFDPLEMDRYTRLQELTRMMAESVGDVTTVQQNLLRNLDHADLALHSQARLSRDLQQALMRVRMVPFDSLADRLYRVVRQTAKDLNKRANLDLRGGRIEVDRGVLEHMTAPLEHLLRNAVAHGVEPAETRRAAGKDEIGQLTLDVRQEGNEVVITLSDDGAGLDYARIAERARANGLLAPDEPADERRLTNLIFVPGFSTAGSLSSVSGRGVGMDVVKSETAAVGGRVDVNSTPGKGTQFRVYLPLTLAVTQAVLVRAGGRTYAIPSSMIAQVMELKADAVERLRETGGTEWQGERFDYRYLPRLLGDPHAQPELQRFNWVLLLRAGAQTLALHVDALRGNQEIVVKNAGPQLVRIVGISGATVLGDGEIVLILNPVALASRSLTAGTPAPAAGPVAEAPAEPRQPTVMVVDDSLTVRKITGRLLEREGFRVITAKDGVDALEILLETLPDVILSDIEMPRMDGFDLLRNIRADERTRAVPVIMITSRLADKHRDYAARIGADHYLGKPYDEGELLALLRSYVADAVPA